MASNTSSSTRSASPSSTTGSGLQSLHGQLHTGSSTRRIRWVGFISSLRNGCSLLFLRSLSLCLVLSFCLYRWQRFLGRSAETQARLPPGQLLVCLWKLSTRGERKSQKSAKHLEMLLSARSKSVPRKPRLRRFRLLPISSLRPLLQRMLKARAVRCCFVFASQTV